MLASRPEMRPLGNQERLSNPYLLLLRYAPAASSVPGEGSEKASGDETRPLLTVLHQGVFPNAG